MSGRYRPRRPYRFTRRRGTELAWSSLSVDAGMLLGSFEPHVHWKGFKVIGYRLYTRGVSEPLGAAMQVYAPVQPIFNLPLRRLMPAEILGPNRDFEEAIPGNVPALGVAPAGWATSPAACWGVSDAAASGGVHAIWFYVAQGYNVFSSADHIGSCVSEAQVVTPGVTYVASGRYRQVDFVAGGFVRMLIEWFDASDRFLSYAGLAGVAPNMASFAWIQFPSVTAVAPDGAVFARLRFVVDLPAYDGTGTYSVYFDSASLVGQFPGLLPESLYAYKVMYVNGLESDFSEWLVPSGISRVKVLSGTSAQIPETIDLGGLYDVVDLTIASGTYYLSSFGAGVEGDLLMLMLRSDIVLTRFQLPAERVDYPISWGDGGSLELAWVLNLAGGTSYTFRFTNGIWFLLAPSLPHASLSGAPVDESVDDVHHTLGNGATQAAAGDHAHAEPAAIGARVYHSAAQSVNNASWTVLAFNSERWDSDGMHSTTTNNSRITCKTAGKYMITFCGSYASNAAGDRLFQFVLNSTIIGVVRVGANSAAATALSLATIWDLAVGDYVEVHAYQTSGGALNVEANGNWSPEFAAVRIGP